MTVQNLTLRVPGELYQQLKERAERQQRSVEHETLELLTHAVPVGAALPSDLSDSLDALAALDDEGLWRAARSHLLTDATSELESLHFKQQREGLTPSEQEVANALVRQYERCISMRARAAELLRQRGHDVSILLAKP